MFANILFFINVFNFACIISFIVYLVIRFYPQTTTTVAPLPMAPVTYAATPIATAQPTVYMPAPVAVPTMATQIAVPMMPNPPTTAGGPIPAAIPLAQMATAPTTHTRRLAQVLPKTGNAFLTGIKSLF